jgi:hypothetical protein
VPERGVELGRGIRRQHGGIGLLLEISGGRANCREVLTILNGYRIDELGDVAQEGAWVSNTLSASAWSSSV